MARRTKADAETPVSPNANELRLQYIPITQAVKWEWNLNPKEHDIGGMIEAFQAYGFNDPPKVDTNLVSTDGTVGAFVYGNGRTKALSLMYEDRLDPPRGVQVDGKTGEWLIPILFGVDAESEAVARAAAIDHNNLQLTGGDLSLFDISKLYDPDRYMELLDASLLDGILPVTMDAADIEALQGSVDADLPKTEQPDTNAGDGNEDDGAETGSDDGGDDEERYPSIKARLHPDIYTLYLKITEDFGSDDTSRLEGWIKQYQSAMKGGNYAD